jgi:hypothetical protein
MFLEEVGTSFEVPFCWVFRTVITENFGTNFKTVCKTFIVGRVVQLYRFMGQKSRSIFRTFQKESLLKINSEISLCIFLKMNML